jgi:N6-L-threonylcarbamoyladenine synthase
MILALESSCDESAVALFDPARGLCAEWVHSQIALHGRHGGVVPDLATREHLRHFGPLLELARRRGEWKEVGSVAVTRGPGLAACLAVGVSSAKALSLALRVPLVGVNHLRGHAWSPFIPVHAQSPADFEARLAGLLPHLGLVVSGGNTLLFSLAEDRTIRVLASTRDDAAGEALDKGAKLLGLGYPGGPLVERNATGGNPAAYDFPRGIGPRSDLDFSFSGLKTSLRYLIEKMSLAEVGARMPDLCASYQQAVIDALIRKAGLALSQGAPQYRSIGLSGGVSNNRSLRSALEKLASSRHIPSLIALPAHSGDNAGMIAFAAWADPRSCDSSGLSLDISPSLEL